MSNLIESYILIRKPTNRPDFFETGVGDSSTLEVTGLLRYEKEPEILDISEWYMESSIGAWHENIDEEIFTRFDSGDMTITLSLFQGEYSGVRPLTKEYFYDKLQANILYRYMQQWLNADNAIDKLTRYELSIVTSYGKCSWGVIDKSSVVIDEGRGTITFSVYDGMTVLEKFPVSMGSYIEDYSDSIRKWQRIINPSDAFDWIWDGVGTGMYNFKASEYLDNFDTRIEPGSPIDFDGWMLSFESSVDDDKNIIDFRWDGQYLWLLCEGDEDYRISIATDETWGWAASSDFAECDNLPFFRWEAQTDVGTEPTTPPSTYVSELARGTIDEVTFAPIDYFVANGYYDYNTHEFVGMFNNTLGYGIHRYDFAGYNISGEPQWTNTATINYVGSYDSSYFSILKHPTSGALFYSMGSRLYKYVSGTDTIIGNTTDRMYSSINYLYSTGLLLNGRYIAGGGFDILEIRNSLGERTGVRSGSIPTLNDYSEYNLDWEDIDIKSLFEVKLDSFTGTGTETYIAGYTKRSPVRFFLLNSDLTRCVYYTNLEQAIGMPLGSRCYITRRVVEDSVSGDYRNYIHGYCGDGTIKGGVFFSFRLGSTGNIRVLNLDKMNMASFMQGLATFSNSFFFIENYFDTDSMGRNIAYPQINLIDRTEYEAGSYEFALDEEWDSWQIRPQYKNLKGVVDVDFNGGKIKVGADLDDFILPVMTGGTDYLDLSYFDNLVDKVSMSCPFVFDLNYAQFIGRRTLSFLWKPRQEWTMEVRLQDNPYRLLDRVYMHVAGSQEIKVGIVISIDFDPINTKKATLKCITVDEADPFYVPTNPIVIPDPISQPGVIDPIS